MNQKQMQLNIKLSDTKKLECPECGNDTFQMSFLMRMIPAVLAPSGQETVWPVQIFECTKCGAKLPETLPSDE